MAKASTSDDSDYLSRILGKAGQEGEKPPMNMDFNTDHFSLFHLPRIFRLEIAALDRVYREIQARVHPDKFAGASDREKRLSLQWATHVNEAYQTLKSPLSRAQYLLSLASHAVDVQNHTTMDTNFLVEQMQWREEVEEARSAGDIAALERIYRQIEQRIEADYAQLADLLDDASTHALAAERVRQLMFLEKLLYGIDAAIVDLDE